MAVHPSPAMTDQPLKTVRVPESMAPLFRMAEEVVSRYFSQREDRPEMGSIEIRPFLDQTHSATGEGRPPL